MIKSCYWDINEVMSKIASAVRNKENKSVSKTEIPPYGLKQRHRPQFPMPTDRGSRLPHLFGGTRISHPNITWNGNAHCLSQYYLQWAFIPEVMSPPLWLRASQSSPKGEKTCLDSRPTRMQNFTPLSLSAAEKSVTVQKTKWQKKLHTVN